MVSRLSIAVVFTVAVFGAREARAGGPQLQYVWGGAAGTVVFIHGKSDCSTSMTSCSSSTRGPVGYWTNSYNNYDMLNEATTKYTWNGKAQVASYYEAFVIGFDYEKQ
ncbi:MAG TPA: hypothetical protein VGF94_19180, partial [Kofleriaceae bacterium]